MPEYLSLEEGKIFEDSVLELQTFHLREKFVVVGEHRSVSQFLLIEILKDAGLVGILSSQFLIHPRAFLLHLAPPLLAGIRPRCEVLQLDEGVLDQLVDFSVQKLKIAPLGLRTVLLSQLLTNRLVCISIIHVQFTQSFLLLPSPVLYQLFRSD